MTLEGSRVVVTGAAGFIGTHLVEALVACGADVVGVDVRPCDVVADVCDGHVMERALSGARYVVHLAGIPGVRGTGPQYHRVNHDGTVATLRAARAAGVERVVLASSSSVYGPATTALVETSELAPRSDYARSKVAAEKAARGLVDDLVVLRYFTVFGPRQRPDMLCHRLLTSALTGEPVEIFGTGTQTRPFTYVDDAVAGTLAALVSEDADGTYNIAGTRSVSVLEMASLVEAHVGTAPVLVHRDRLDADADRVQVSVAKAFDDLGYVPQVGPVEGISRQCDALLRRPSAVLGSSATPSSPSSPRAL